MAWEVVCGNFLGLWEAKNEKSVSLTDSDVNTFLEGKENQYTKKKPKY